jgi:hypothetical protein
VFEDRVMRHIFITFYASCQSMNLIGRMKFAAQTQSSLLCLWRDFTTIG